MTKQEFCVRWGCGSKFIIYYDIVAHHVSKTRIILSYSNAKRCGVHLTEPQQLGNNLSYSNSFFFFSRTQQFPISPITLFFLFIPGLFATLLSSLDIIFLGYFFNSSWLTLSSHFFFLFSFKLHHDICLAVECFVFFKCLFII